MNVKPTQLDREFLLLAILYSMAMFVPSAFIATFGWDSSFLSQLFLAVFAVLLILTVTMAGTQRKIFIAVAALVSVAIAWGVSRLYDFSGLGDDATYYPDPENLEMLDGGFSEFAMFVGTSAVGMFVVSFALSFVFDKVIGPVVSRDSLVAKEGVRGDESGVKKTATFRAMAILAIALFVVQVSINGGGRGNIELVAMSFLILAGVALASRFSTWQSAATLVVFTFAIVIAAIQWLTVKLATEINASEVAMLWAGVFAGHMAVWMLVANSKTNANRLPGWLGWLSVAILGSSIWMINNYDIGSLLFSPDRFDFGIARKIKNINSHPSVSVRMTSEYARRTRCEIVFEDEKGIDDFFVTNPLPDVPMVLSITGMPDSVDLSELAPLTFLGLEFENSDLSSAQLSKLVEVQQVSGLRTVAFDDCRFIPGDCSWPAMTFTPNFQFNGTLAGETANFFESVDGLDGFGLSLWQFSGNSSDARAIADGLKSRPGKLRLFCADGDAELVKELDTSVDLSEVTFSNVDLKSDGAEIGTSNRYLDLILNSDVRMTVDPPPEDMFWDLSIAAKAQISFLKHLDLDEVTNEPHIPSELDEKSLRERGLVYDKTNIGEPITKLFLPLHGPTIVKNLSRHPQLTALSFDDSWLNARNYLERREMPASLSSLNELNELQELYFPKWGSRISFEGLTERSKIETLQFQASSTGFDRSIFPNLKHLILVLDEAPSATLTQQLAGMTSLEKLTIMPLGVTQSFPFQTIANQLKGLLPNAQVEETQFQLGLAPEDFRQHRQRVRQMSIEKYLK